MKSNTMDAKTNPKGEIAKKINDRLREVRKRKELARDRKEKVGAIMEKIASRLKTVFASSSSIFDPVNTAFVLLSGWRYNVVLILEDTMHESKSFVDCGSIIPFSSSVGRFKPARKEETDEILVKHASDMAMLAGLVEGMREHTFAPVPEIDLADMSVTVDDAKYYLSLQSAWSLSTSSMLIDAGFIVPRSGFVADPKASDD